MITLKDDSLEFRFPEVHRDARCTIEFQRTLRIPDDGRDILYRRVWAASPCGTSTTSRGACRSSGAAGAV